MQGSPRIDELRQKFHENPRRYFAPLANEYRKAGDPEQAIAICRAHLAQQPGHMSGHVVYGQALFDAQRIDEARTVFEKALSLDPDNPIVLRQLGDIARQRGETAEAKHWYSRALDADPHDPEVAAYIAELTEPLTEVTEPTGEGAETSQPESEVVGDAERAGVGTEEREPVAAASEVAEPVRDTIEVIEKAPEPVETSPERPEALEVAESAPDAIELIEPASDAGDQAEAAEASTAAEPPDEGTEPARSRADERADIPLAPLVVPLADVAWRKTPPHEDSPFVTRTMAELYAKQGYRSAALDVYRQLALNNPDDQEILARIEELAGEPGRVADATPAGESTTGAEQSSMQGEEPVTEETASAPSADEPLEDSAILRDDVAYPPSSEDVTQEPEPPAPATDERHFTELELSAGDTWDTDAWGAGFSSEESTDVEIGMPDVPMEAPAAPPRLETIESLTTAVQQDVGVDALDTVADLERETEHEAVAESHTADDLEVTHVADQQEIAAESVVEQSALAEEPDAAQEPVIADEPDIIEEPFPVKESAPAAEADDEPHLVAYSPQPPDDEDLAHYEPKGPTVREFFATLRARKPPSRESARSFTARAAVPTHEAATDYPLAGTAFADLFPDSAVAEEDTRAAFALSGAVTSSPAVAVPVPSVPAAETRTPPPAPPAPEGGQESEEEIRRFREWLDGLAES